MTNPSFLDVYAKTKNKDQLRKDAFFYFNDKYYKTPFQEYWIFEQTERFKARKLKFFIPGRVYTFQYTPHTKDDLSYYDKRPMVYVFGEYVSESTGYNILQGINLNFLPEKAKVLFLNTALTLFQKAYAEADKMSDMDRISSMKAINLMVTNWFFMAQNFNRRAKIGLEFATRNYDIAKIQRPVLIELEDFEMIPFYVPREFAGKPPAFIYQLYLRSRDKIVKNSNTKNTSNEKARQIQKKFKKPGSS
jgi:hypothetical protein